MLETLRKFMLTPAPSGYEGEMAAALKAALAPYADDVETDRVGNVIARVRGTQEGLPPVMAFAHMDQLGMIIRCIEPDGLLRVDRLGGLPEKILPALRVLVRSDEGAWVPGIIGTKSHHAANNSDAKYQVDPVTSLWLDVGAASADEARAMGLGVGNPAIYRPHFETMGDRVCGTAVDDRGGCAALVQAARRLAERRPAADVFLVGSVQEEFNLRGAIIAARRIRPGVALCLDVVLSGDTPELKGRYETKVGAGPAVSLYSFHGRGTLNGTLAHPGLFGLARETADRMGISLQRFAGLGLLTDAAYVQLENEGVACLDLGFATRYTHSPVEMCSLRDVEVLGDLTAALAAAVDGRFSLNRY